ncbi:MAG: isoprenylcysteine carboxylmethyltransferase family protein [Vicinamibacterales bacterium]
MRLAERAVAQGQWCFRHRGFLPLLLLPLAVLAMPESVAIERAVGEGWHDVWTACCLVLALAGLALRAYAVGYAPDGTSGRDTRAQRAEVLNTTGLYSVVRHPLYVGNSLAMFAIVLSLMVPWLALVTALLLWLYHERIMLAEEQFLHQRFGPVFEEWAARTPAVWPAWSLWTPARRAFSWRRVLRSEFNGLLAIVAVITLFEGLTDIELDGRGLAGWAREDWGWVLVLALATTLFLVLVTVKKRTRWLRDDFGLKIAD